MARSKRKQSTLRKVLLTPRMHLFESGKLLCPVRPGCEAQCNFLSLARVWQPVLGRDFRL